MLEYRPLPDNLKPMAGGQFIEGGLAYKPVFGAMGTLAVRFYMGSSYNEARSMKEGLECYDKEEMCEIVVDKYTKHTPRVKDLDNKQLLDLGPLLQAFRDQKDSTDTQIISWLIITEHERAHLVTQNIYTVEQLAAFDPDQDSFRFGRDGRNLIMKARQHVAGKQVDKGADVAKEMELLRAEISALRAKSEAREDAYIKSQIALAAKDKRNEKTA